MLELLVFLKKNKIVNISFWEVHNSSNWTTQYFSNQTSFEERLPRRDDHIPLISFVYHYQSFLISHEQSVEEVFFVVIIFYELGALMPVPPRVKGSQISANQKIKLVQYEKIMNYLLLPHELK